MDANKENIICFAEDSEHKFLRKGNSFFVFYKNRLKDNFELYKNMSQDNLNKLQNYLMHCPKYYDNLQQTKLSKQPVNTTNGDITKEDINNILYDDANNKTIFSIKNLYLNKNSEILLLASENLFKFKKDTKNNRRNAITKLQYKNITNVNVDDIENYIKNVKQQLNFDDSKWRLYIPSVHQDVEDVDTNFIDAVFYTTNTNYLKDNYCVYIFNDKGKKKLELYKTDPNTCPFNSYYSFFGTQIFSIDMDDISTADYSINNHVVSLPSKISPNICIQAKNNSPISIKFNGINDPVQTNEIILSANVDELEKNIKEIKENIHLPKKNILNNHNNSSIEGDNVKKEQNKKSDNGSSFLNGFCDGFCNCDNEICNFSDTGINQDQLNNSQHLE